MKIDLHLHTSERSMCSISSAEEQITTAIQMGLDAIVITDHDCMIDETILASLNRKYAPFKIYGGIEIRINENGYDEDLIVIGLHQDILTQKQWTYPELHQFVISNNGFIGLAHPYRYRDFISVDVENYPPHAIEIFSSNIGMDKKEMRLQLKEKLNCNLMSNSDSHSINSTGKYYNELNRTPKSEQELIKMLIDGDYTLSIPI
ncbi:MAG: PHP domain-containing protein [Clostridiales bacterium]|nr:PHP domain-containing protein [Clostridiales bacterium]